MKKRFRAETAEEEFMSKILKERVPSPSPSVAPFVAYDHRMRSLLDAVDRLRDLKIMKEGIQLPTIVVVGDQSFGKSSVLESLAGICLPRGVGLCTRVPLIMKLKNDPTPELSIEFNGKIILTDEENVARDITNSTEEIVGNGNFISNKHLTLNVRKKGLPDLTMVDLPGIIRVVKEGMPKNMYQVICNMIMKYIRPRENIILNVVPAGLDVDTSDSIRMSQEVDEIGERSLCVITKSDLLPEQVLKRVTAYENIGLGYVCVRNRIGDETQEEARDEEAMLFESDQFLSKIDKSKVGIPVLAKRLMDIQYTMIVKCLPEILHKIDEKIWLSNDELNMMPKLNSICESKSKFLDCIRSAGQLLFKIFMGQQFKKGAVPLLLNKYKDEMISSTYSGSNFMEDELLLLQPDQLNWLPDFGVTKDEFLCLLKKKVDNISAKPSFECAEKIWHHVEEVVISVLEQHLVNFPQLLPGTVKLAQDLIATKKRESKKWVQDVIEMEGSGISCCESEYIDLHQILMSEKGDLITAVRGRSKYCKLSKFGSVDIAHLRGCDIHLLGEAFNVKMKMTSYWNIHIKRLIGNMELHFNLSIKKLTDSELAKKIIDEWMGLESTDFEKMLEELPSISEKRKNLQSSLELLKEAREIIVKTMDSAQ